MRLTITAILVSILTVGGFFGFKLYQRAGMKQDAEAYLLTMINRHSADVDASATAQVTELVLSHADEAFRQHYTSGGLTKPAEFNEIAFTRLVYESAHEQSRSMELDEQAEQLMNRLYAQSRPIRRGGLGGVGGGRLPNDNTDSDGEDPTPEAPDDGSD